MKSTHRVIVKFKSPLNGDLLSAIRWVYESTVDFVWKIFDGP